MEPVPETREALERLTRYDDGALRRAVDEMAEAVRQVVPECVGLSIGLRESGLTLTLVASDEELAAIDAVQYLDGGPCVDAADRGLPVEVDETSVVDEGLWQMYAEATAAAGVRSSLSLPILHDEEVIGGVNIYAATPSAFEGHVERLAEVVGVPADRVIRNADLSFSTRLQAVCGPTAVVDTELVEIAVGILMELHGARTDAARERLRRAAARAGITLPQAARVVVDARSP